MLLRLLSFLLGLLALLIVVCVSLLRSRVDLIVIPDRGPNALAQQAKPYVILLSVDGLRYDYAQLYEATHLKALAARGASAPSGMIPAYIPSTRPNHHTIMTGLYPAHHGVIANDFYDPEWGESFRASGRGDGRWYGGTPLWVLAEREGMRTASALWPGSEAEIAGVRPTYSIRRGNAVSNRARVDQVLAWLRLPPEQRPHFIAVHLAGAAGVDRAGHDYGSESPETERAVRRADALIGRLVAGLGGLSLPVNLFVVSDHGMDDVIGDWVNLEEFADLSGFVTIDSLLYPPSEAAAERVYQQLHEASPRFVVYRQSQVPPHYRFSGDSRMGDPVVIPTGPYLIRARAPEEESEPRPTGDHVFDPHRVPTMRTVFYAVGPAIRPGIRLGPFENVHVYPLIARILGLPTGAIDGDIRVLEPILRRSGHTHQAILE